MNLIDKRIVYAQGCFDLFHVGHLNYLEAAASLGDFLVVGINTDEFMRAYKGSGTIPIIPFDQRKKIIGALRCVDATVSSKMDDFSVFDRYNVAIRAVNPEYGCCEFQDRAIKELERRGIRRVILPRTPNISTAMIKERIGGEL